MLLALTGGRVIPVANCDIDEGTVLIDSGRILDVGSRIEIPEDCETIDCAGRVVLPGFVDPHCHIGLFVEGEDTYWSDANEMSSPAVPQVRALDALDPFDIAFQDAPAAGFTTVLVTPGSGDVICGQSTVIKTSGTVADQMVLRHPAGMKFAFGGNPKNPYKTKAENHPTTRMGVAAVFREAMYRARDYTERKEADTSTPLDLGMEALAMVLQRKMPARVHVSRGDDILTVIRLCKEFGVDFTLEHVTDGHLVVGEIVDSGAPCVVGPFFRPRGVSETRNWSFVTPGVLAKAGVKVALTVDHPFTPLRHARYSAAMAIRAGMDERDALRAMTINAAQIAGVGDRVGSIEPGKDADLVVMTDHPFKLQADVEMTLIGGKVVFRK